MNFCLSDVLSRWDHEDSLNTVRGHAHCMIRNKLPVLASAILAFVQEMDAAYHRHDSEGYIGAAERIVKLYEEASNVAAEGSPADRAFKGVNDVVEPLWGKIILAKQRTQLQAVLTLNDTPEAVRLAEIAAKCIHGRLDCGIEERLITLLGKLDTEGR